MSTKTVFETLAAEINALRGSPVVAIDGVDGSGKTTFTKSLAAQLNERPAIVIHVDDFLNPPEIRHRRGRCRRKASGSTATTTTPSSVMFSPL